MNPKCFIHYTACAMVTVVQQEINCRSGQNEQSENTLQNSCEVTGPSNI